MLGAIAGDIIGLVYEQIPLPDDLLRVVDEFNRTHGW